MARTTVPGSRIGEGSIENRHLSRNFKISEDNIEFRYEQHEHKNLPVLSVLSNSIPQTLTALDLKDVLYTIIEVSDAREVNKTLRQTLDGKATVEEINDLVREINEAKRGYSTLNEFFVQFEYDINVILNNHMGAITHRDLDSMYSEVKAARGIYVSLKERLDDITANGGGAGGGAISINMLTPWSFDMELAPGMTIVELPNSYEPGNSTLQVFDGPLLLSADVDYKETSPTKITFLKAYEESLDLRVIGVNSGRLFEWERRVLGNGVFTRIDLPDSYRPGFRELQVYEDGLLLREDEDYTEVAPHVLEMKQAIPSGSILTIYKRRN